MLPPGCVYSPFLCKLTVPFLKERSSVSLIYDGHYDQGVLANGLEALGFPNPLRSDFRMRDRLPWGRKGRLDAQGIAFVYEQKLWRYFSLGFNTLFAHVDSRHEFLLREQELQLSEGDKHYLFGLKESIHEKLGITPPLYRHTGLGDIDLYLRVR